MAENPIVLYLGAPEGGEAAAAVLDGVAELRAVDPVPQSVAAALQSAAALLDASMKVRITEEMLDGALHLKIISCATTGSDHIDRRTLEARGVVLRTLREDREFLANITPAAELSWTLLMACARRLKGAMKHADEGNWVRELYPGIMLNGKVLGLVGCGRIGGWMARYARAFGMTVRVYDPYQTRLPEGASPASLAEVVSGSDFLSVHVHLSDETRGLVSRGLLESCKPGAVLINTSRGGIVDESALLDGLVSGRIAAAGVDVLDGEPETSSHPLVRYARTNENLLITPHIGGFSPDAVRLVCGHAAQKIRAALSVP